MAAPRLHFPLLAQSRPCRTWMETYRNRLPFLHRPHISCAFNNRIARRFDFPFFLSFCLRRIRLHPGASSEFQQRLYSAIQVNNGCQMKPSATVLAPDIQVSDKNVTNELFTLVMTDPDAPSPSEPSMREWVHWIVTDIPGHMTESTSGVMLLKEQVVSAGTKGNEVVPYMSPRPPIGIHRYVFVLFKQPNGPVLVSPPPARNNFDTRSFAAKYGLGLPVAATYFNAQREPGNRRR